MSTTIHVFSFNLAVLVLVLVMCFSSSTPFGDSPISTPAIANMSSMQVNPNDTNINLVALTFRNDMAPGGPNVYLYYDINKDSNSNRILLKAGVPFTEITGTQRLTGLVYWSALCVIFYQYDPATDGGHSDVYWSALCVIFYQYDPATDGGHSDVYWSVTSNGVYHSWDNHYWDLKGTWRDDNCN